MKLAGKSLARRIRLLPAVIVVGALLLGLKGEGLVRAALAEGIVTVAADDSALSQDTAPLPQNLATAGGDSAGKADVLNSLVKRSDDLDARAAELDARAQLVAAAEKRVDGKIATLKTLQDQIAQLLGHRDDAEKKQLADLVKTYSSMKPKDAARIFNGLDDSVLVPVAAAIKADVLAPILANMNSDAAKALTVKLATRLKTPEVAAPPIPPLDPAVICKPAGEGQGPATTAKTPLTKG